jgi:hypothetical protein
VERWKEGKGERKNIKIEDVQYHCIRRLQDYGASQACPIVRCVQRNILTTDIICDELTDV